MGRWIEEVEPTIPRGMPGYSATGFRAFVDSLRRFGMEYFGLYYGVYRGIVVSVEDADNEGNPDPQGRIHVRVPAIGDADTVSRLAYPRAMSAGSGFGFKDVPKVGDQVYVEFEFGNPDMPLWSGGWWAKNELPDSLKSLLARGWVTPGGHELVFVEDEGSTEVRLKHANGASIVIDHDGNMTISNVGSKKVTVGSGSNENAVLGDTLKSLLEQTLDAVSQITVPTGTGPSGPPLNVAVFQQIKGRLQQALSGTVKVAK